MNRKYCITSAVVFALVAMAHAWRFVLDAPLQIGAWNVSRSLSAVAAIGAASLAVWAFRSARIETRPVIRYIEIRSTVFRAAGACPTRHPPVRPRGLVFMVFFFWKNFSFFALLRRVGGSCFFFGCFLCGGVGFWERGGGVGEDGGRGGGGGRPSKASPHISRADALVTFPITADRPRPRAIVFFE